MNESDPQSTPTPGLPRIRQWFNRRHLPKYLLVLACFGTLAVLLPMLKSRRALQVPPPIAGAVPAQAERIVAAKFIPPLAPDEDNFAATPFFASLFDKSIQTGASQWPDDFSRADQWPRRSPAVAASEQGRRSGRLVTDLVAWQK